jgi:hypothetical protein
VCCVCVVCVYGHALSWVLTRVVVVVAVHAPTVSIQSASQTRDQTQPPTHIPLATNPRSPALTTSTTTHAHKGPKFSHPTNQPGQAPNPHSPHTHSPPQRHAPLPSLPLLLPARHLEPQAAGKGPLDVCSEAPKELVDCLGGRDGQVAAAGEEDLCVCWGGGGLWGWWGVLWWLWLWVWGWCVSPSRRGGEARARQEERKPTDGSIAPVDPASHALICIDTICTTYIMRERRDQPRYFRLLHAQLHGDGAPPHQPLHLRGRRGLCAGHHPLCLSVCVCVVCVLVRLVWGCRRGKRV